MVVSLDLLALTLSLVYYNLLRVDVVHFLFSAMS